MIPVHADKALDILQLVLYIPLLLLSQYCLIRHGKQGLLGWLYVSAFCIIRLIAAGLKIHSDTTGTQSSGAVIVDNIGLSPVILGALGLLHEAYVLSPLFIDSCPYTDKFRI
jgi:prolipoprotein diacylglyceryltransferase